MMMVCWEFEKLDFKYWKVLIDIEFLETVLKTILYQSHTNIIFIPKSWQYRDNIIPIPCLQQGLKKLNGSVKLS